MYFPNELKKAEERYNKYFDPYGEEEELDEEERRNIEIDMAYEANKDN